LNIHEYQAKEILRRHGLALPAGAVADNVTDAVRAAKDIGGTRWAVKAQVHAGGRAEAQGVRIVDDLDAVDAAARDLLGSRIVTEQTGAAGKPVRQVYVEAGVDYDRELYLAVLVDRSLGRVAFIAAKEGGADVEAMAAADPNSILRFVVDPDLGLDRASAAEFAARLDLDGGTRDAAVDAMAAMYGAFIACDASLIEINPLVVTREGDLLALDLKMTLDDNALFRHRELESLRDVDEVDPTEVEAKRYELNFVKLDGDIGVMVNGAGLALATVDLLTERGGAPADFMDVRPVATRDQIATGFKMLLTNPKVKAILVNVYGGGILRCDTVAEGVAGACREIGLRVPLIVRFAGTNSDIAEKTLTSRGIAVAFAENMMAAADNVVRAAKGV
jgi:succinyl-CoA synthetase beta subunit